MEIILLEKVRNLGALGDKVNVKPGFARNFLIPQKKAEFATKANVEKFEARRAELEKLADEKVAIANARKEKLEALSISIPANAGDEGKLFGSIGTRDIAIAITEAGVPAEKSEVMLPEGTIRTIGDFEICINLHTDVVATVKVAIVAE